MFNLGNFFNLGGLRLKEQPVKSAQENDAEFSAIVTWEITVVLTGHVHRCREKNFAKKECICKSLSICEEYEDICMDLREFIRRAELTKWCSNPRYRLDVTGRPHVFIRCSRHIAEQLANFTERVGQIEKVRNDNWVWQ